MTPERTSWTIPAPLPKPLPKPEQLALCRLAQQGDVAARHRLVQTNLRFVYHHARTFAKKTPLLDLDDIVGAGVLGLLDAVAHFDFSRSDNFLTYATHWVQLRMRETVVQTAIRISAPTDVLTRVWSNRFAKDRARLLSQGVAPDDADAAVARMHSMLPARLSAAETLRRPIVSMDQSLNDAEDPVTLHDVLPCPMLANDIALADVAWTAQMHIAIALMGSKMPYSRRIVVAQRIVAGRPLSAVAKMLGVTPERVRQIEGKLLVKLRQGLTAQFPTELGRYTRRRISAAKSAAQKASKPRGEKILCVA